MSGGDGGGQEASALMVGRMLRMLRLFRAARLIKVLKKHESVMMLINRSSPSSVLPHGTRTGAAPLGGGVSAARTLAHFGSTGA